MLEYETGVEIYKSSADDPLNKDHAPMVRYFNFLLKRERAAYFRQRYNLMDILGEVGGAQAFLAAICIFLIIPFTYKRHGLKVLKQY